MMRDSQDLIWQAVLLEGVTTVRQTLGRGFERYHLVMSCNWKFSVGRIFLDRL
jgi:hypothetical protein